MKGASGKDGCRSRCFAHPPTRGLPEDVSEREGPYANLTLLQRIMGGMLRNVPERITFITFANIVEGGYQKVPERIRMDIF